MTMQDQRQGWMSLLAKAPAEDLRALWQKADRSDGYSYLRPPEIGAAMVRGRTGGTGAPFNLGEMTITRCSLRLEDGTVGHAYVQGRDKEKARIAALIDALMQTDAANRLNDTVLKPLAEGLTRRTTQRAAKAAATKVEFFTMARGED